MLASQHRSVPSANDPVMRTTLRRASLPIMAIAAAILWGVIEFFALQRAWRRRAD
jgi:hypothetical protein